ncbi:flagellar biosynthetic protein FliO [Noviherbaspirillum sp. ST9]|uniref:flagellar biosynthetic protein FliO n=1 Tax=Noviherbaspirillum sp. ST9 TaxID=3401606 RepID=UPI003B58AB7B
MIRPLSFLTIALLASLPARAAEEVASTASTASAGSLIQVLFGLVVVLALMAGAAWMLKRMGMTSAGGNSVAKVIGGVSVGNRERVVVVEVGEQWIVVGVAPGRVNSLATMPRQETMPVATAADNSKNFAAWLKQTIDKRNGN